jgi:hypothetical protein
MPGSPWRQRPQNGASKRPWRRLAGVRPRQMGRRSALRSQERRASSSLEKRMRSEAHRPGYSGASSARIRHPKPCEALAGEASANQHEAPRACSGGFIHRAGWLFLNGKALLR